MKIREQYEPQRWQYDTEEEYEHALAAFEYAWACAEEYAKETRPR